MSETGPAGRQILGNLEVWKFYFNKKHESRGSERGLSPFHLAIKVSVVGFVAVWFLLVWIAPGFLHGICLGLIELLLSHVCHQGCGFFQH